MADFQQLDDADMGDGSDGAAQPNTNAKRKRDDNATGQHRAKRNRYISIACNECKRRKIKCNGETPCQRCGNLNLECIYSPNCCSNNFRDSPEFKQLHAQVNSLQEQVDHLAYNLNALRGSIGQDELRYALDTGSQLAQDPAQQVPDQANIAIDPALQARSRQRSSPQQSRFQGPTSSGFGLGVARSSLRNMGIANAEESIAQPAPPQNDDRSQRFSSGAQQSMRDYPQQAISPSSGVKTLHESKDPIWALSKDEALRLCRVFEEETHIMYPVVDMPAIVRHATMLFQFIDALSRNVQISALPGADNMQDQDTDILKLVFAITLVIEGTGRSELGRKLFDNVNRGTDTRLLGSVNIKDIQILTLTAQYHFHTDDEGLAWRVIGLTARLCLELGLHRHERYETLFATEQERMTGLKLFWSIYVLDHRWSFGTGMSFALQESDIDRQLPKLADSTPYLSAMIDYCNISAKCWKYISTSDPSSSSFTKDEIHHLDFEITQWYNNLPESLRLVHPDSVEFSQHASDPNEAMGRSIHRQRVLLHLRRNQMRIAIYRTVLYSSSAMQSSISILTLAETAVEVAKDTMHILTYINTRSDIYMSRQITYNHFLLSALSVLFLAVCHAPAQFAESCRDEFYMALELVRRLSAHSFVSKRLWHTIRGLKKLAPKIGLYARQSHKSGTNGPKSAGLNGYSSQNASQHSGAQSAYAQTPQPQLDYQQQLQQQQQQTQQPQNDAQRSAAAMAMAGLAGHPIDESVFFTDAATGQPLDSPTALALAAPDARFTSPNGIANELTSLFEAAGAYANAGTMGYAGGGGQNVHVKASASPQDFRSMGDGSGGGADGTTPSSANGRANVGGANAGAAPPLLEGDSVFWDTNDEELNKILRDLF